VVGLRLAGYDVGLVGQLAHANVERAALKKATASASKMRPPSPKKVLVRRQAVAAGKKTAHASGSRVAAAAGRKTVLRANGAGGIISWTAPATKGKGKRAA
jgi:hypothetical protein